MWKRPTAEPEAGGVALLASVGLEMHWRSWWAAGFGQNIIVYVPREVEMVSGLRKEGQGERQTDCQMAQPAACMGLSRVRREVAARQPSSCS